MLLAGKSQYTVSHSSTHAILYLHVSRLQQHLPDKIGWSHHVCRVHRQSKKWWECELCEYDTYWEQCMREHLIRSHKLSTSAVQLALTSNCRYDADKVIEQPCYFCHNLYTCEGLRDHLIEHMEHITSLLF
jgi:hypothetical protein